MSDTLIAHEPVTNTLPTLKKSRGKGDGSPLQPFHWTKGQSGNPGGKTALQGECVRLARDLCPEAIRRTAEIMRNTDDERAALVAIGILLDRGLGKPKEIKEDNQAVMPALTSLSQAQLAALKDIMSKLAGQDEPQPASTAEATDNTTSSVEPAPGDAAQT